MVRDFTIGCYRGLEGLKIKDLAKVNIFVGPNNCGKTSILEAIIFSRLYNDVDLFIDTFISRYQKFSAEYFESLFSIDKEPVICLKLRDDKKELHTHITYKKSRVIRGDDSANITESFELQFSYSYEDTSGSRDKDYMIIRFEEDKENYKVSVGSSAENNSEYSYVPCKFIAFSRFDRSERLLKDVDALLDQNLRGELIEILKIFDQDIINFEVIGKNRTIKLFKTGQKKPLTLSDYGNGMYKAFYIATSALLSADGILLIDEIEAGIHNRALTKFISRLLEVCEKRNVQLFLTTHSLEAIDIILDDCRESLADIAVYHIKNQEQETKARRYGGNKLVNLRKEIGFDVR